MTSGVGQNSAQRFGNPGGNSGNNDFVTQNSLFFSTKGGSGTEWNGWISGEWRGYSGGISGSSLDFVVGIDRLVAADAILGGLIAYGRTNVTDGGGAVSAISPAIGVYYGQRMANGLVVDGTLSVARPSYTTIAGNFTSLRTAVTVVVTGGTSNRFTPYAEIRAFREAQPAYGAVAANLIESTNVELGGRYDFGQLSGWGGFVPMVDVAIDYRYQNSTANGVDLSLFPRIALSVAKAGEMGSFAAAADFGKSRSDTFDVGVSLSWEFKF